MHFIITIDTEEDNWGYTAEKYTTTNIERLYDLQLIFNDFDVKPVYLVTYQVAIDNKAVAILKSILKEKKCTIGSHCHPWSTPPYVEEKNKINSMLCNLPVALQYKKLQNLHRTITDSFGIEPVIFRAGRYGFDPSVAENIYRLGYKIDTSITPFISWKDYGGPDFTNYTPVPFKYFLNSSEDSYLIELPVTIGFSQDNFARCNELSSFLGGKSFFKKLKIKGILYHMRLLNLVWLSPEQADYKKMINLVKKMKKENYSFLNMTFHSPSLKAGLSPFIKNKEDEKRFFNDIRLFLKYIHNEGIKNVNLNEISLT